MRCDEGVLLSLALFLSLLTLLEAKFFVEMHVVALVRDYPVALL